MSLPTSRLRARCASFVSQLSLPELPKRVCLWNVSLSDPCSYSTPEDLIIVEGTLLIHSGAYVRIWISVEKKAYSARSNKMRIPTPTAQCGDFAWESLLMRPRGHPLYMCIYIHLLGIHTWYVSVSSTLTPSTPTEGCIVVGCGVIWGKAVWMYGSTTDIMDILVYRNPSGEIESKFTQKHKWLGKAGSCLLGCYITATQKNVNVCYWLWASC